MSLKRVSLETAELIGEHEFTFNEHTQEGTEGLPLYYYCPEYSKGKEELLDNDYGVWTNIERNGHKTFIAPTLVEIQLQLRKYYKVEVFVVPYHKFIRKENRYQKLYKSTIMCDGRPDVIYSGFEDYDDALEMGLQGGISITYNF